MTSLVSLILDWMIILCSFSSWLSMAVFCLTYRQRTNCIFLPNAITSKSYKEEMPWPHALCSLPQTNASNNRFTGISNAQPGVRGMCGKWGATKRYLGDGDAFPVAHGNDFIKGKYEVKGRIQDAFLVHWVHVLRYNLGQQPQRLQILQDVAALVRDQEEVQCLQARWQAIDTHVSVMVRLSFQHAIKAGKYLWKAEVLVLLDPMTCGQSTGNQIWECVMILLQIIAIIW